MNSITVFTPTFNRGKLLLNLYNSLKLQTYQDFEWVILDDGSTDETEYIVNGFKKESLILINYIKQNNGGKHRAINRGVEEAKGDFFFIVDSDDILPIDSLSTIAAYCEQIKGRSEIAGVVGLRSNKDGQIIGTNMKFEIIECTTLEYRYKYNIIGDRAEVFKTEILKQYPFPEFENEFFLSESIVWDKIATKYKLLFFNKIVYEGEYLEGGLSSQSVKLRSMNPIGATTLYTELSQYNVPLKIKLKATINYWRFARYIKTPFIIKIKKIGLLKTLLILPLLPFIYHKDNKIIVNK